MPVPLWAGVLWGFAEATFFFIVPDVLLGWACLSGLRSGTKALSAVLAGSLAGGMLVYGLEIWQPATTRALIEHVPYIRSDMFASVTVSYQEHGAYGMLYGPSSGIPYKIYALLAPQYFGAATFLAMSIPARLERLALVWIVFTLVGRLLSQKQHMSNGIVAAFYGLFWVAIYAFYWSRG